MTKKIVQLKAMRNMKKLSTAICLIAASAAATAGELSLQLHGLSWHAAQRAQFDNTGKEWNERNEGLGVRNTFSDTWSVQFGAYRNSINRTTVYAVANYTPVQVGGVRMGGFAGIGSGYRQQPMFLGGGLVELGPVSVRIIPPVKGVTPLTFGLEVGVPF